ncbi:MAG TPA: membrane protein insertase YidC [Chitinophagaceae bacterium]|nr:membrane protein insertase YidC [Chitinophagaceae bacterium]
MGFDKNTVIGFVLLMGLLGGYIYFAQRGQYAALKEKRRIEDSIKKTQALLVDSNKLKNELAKINSAKKIEKAGVYAGAAIAAEKLTIVENNLLKITFTNKGGQPKIVELKQYKKWDGKPLEIINGEFNKLSFQINTAANQTAQTDDLFYSGGEVVKDGENQVIRFHLQDSTGTGLEHEYVIKPNDYRIDATIKLSGADKLLSQNTLNVLWQVQSNQQEKDVKYEKQQSQVVFMQNNGDYDYYTTLSNSDKKLQKGVAWFSTKQQFFNSTLIAKNKFTSGDVSWTIFPDSTHIVTQVTTHFHYTVPAGATATVPLQFFYGPNDYKLLKSYDIGMHNIVNLGQGIYAFVKYLNRWVVLPAFNFLKGLFGSYGIVIMLLTIFIRLLISPLTYKSYYSGAKMKVLRPEIDELRKKYGHDQQLMSMEQMKLFRTAGVNPLGGCIPALFQIPIFFALFAFFNSCVDLRGQSFLWADNLAAYDSIANLGFNMPFYGSHVSLFTITATLTSFLISWYSMSQTPDTGNPMMKYMPYIFPVILLGIFNSLPSALTWYYTVSNIITLVLQFIIQKFIIDEKKIHAEIQLNKSKPKAKSKWQERLEQIQEAQKQAQQRKK